jgi:metal-sulfur cluster biosynthetic enzyme
MTATLDPEQMRVALKQVIDPEIYENIVDLGLVYGIDVVPQDHVIVTMTLTTPHCPMGPQIIEDVEKTIQAEGAGSVEVKIVWEPAWTPDRMTDALKAQLGIEPEPPLEIEEPAPPPQPRPPAKKSLLARIFGW